MSPVRTGNRLTRLSAVCHMLLATRHSRRRIIGNETRPCATRITAASRSSVTTAWLSQASRLTSRTLRTASTESCRPQLKTISKMPTCTSSRAPSASPIATSPQKPSSTESSCRGNPSNARCPASIRRWMAAFHSTSCRREAASCLAKARARSTNLSIGRAAWPRSREAA